ncbi:MAG: YidC/Oxa1 family membrane protein insertase [Oscillospiraceae bacterium]|nr:YidC/Oxa1 family membrane protein insertase [Oscillospiraceae bacterium]
MNIFEFLITKPFGYLLDFLYQITTNYGVALILFAVLVRVVLLPITAKSRKSMMKMSRLQPRIQAIQKKYANDPQKQQEAIQQLQKEEGASMGCGGCLWSLVPLLILIPLYQVIRQPLVYMLHESAENAALIISTIKEAAPELFGANQYYDQLVAARHIPDFLDALKEAGVTFANALTGEGINFSFLGIDLGQQPVFNIFGADWSWDWNHIGAFLIPVLSAGSQVVSTLLSQRANDSVITNEKGLQDKETAKNSQANQTTKTMLWMMPLMSLWIGFTVPAALSLYWLIGGVVAMVENEILTKHYRKIYDAEDAVRLQKALEEDRIEAEKERVRAERRAANPDGITENTSKKKLQQKQQREQEAARAAAAKEYAAKKGIAEEEQPDKSVPSGIPSRPYCKGRAYDPNRYSSQNTEE